LIGVFKTQTVAILQLYRGI